MFERHNLEVKVC